MSNETNDIQAELAAIRTEREALEKLSDTLDNPAVKVRCVARKRLQVPRVAVPR